MVSGKSGGGGDGGEEEVEVCLEDGPGRGGVVGEGGR